MIVVGVPPVRPRHVLAARQRQGGEQGEDEGGRSHGFTRALWPGRPGRAELRPALFFSPMLKTCSPLTLAIMGFLVLALL
jgi:hypothetical protein